MFERFTARSQRIVVLSQEEARLLHHNYIGTEHLLLGMIHEHDGVAAHALVSLGVTMEVARDLVEEVIGKGGTSPAHLPFTPRAKKVLELALRESVQFHKNYIGTEHLLLALVREGEGVACQILVKLDVRLDEVRTRVISMLDGSYASPTPEVSEPQVVSPAPNKPAVILTHLLGAVSGNSVLQMEFSHKLSPAELEKLGAAITEVLS